MHLIIPELDTPRLKLIPPTIDHLVPYATLYGDSEVMLHLGGMLDRAQIWERLTDTLGHWVLRGFGMWSVQEKASGDIVGRAGLRYPDGGPGIEAGWVFNRQSWGKGYATEAGAAAIAYAFDQLHRDRINAVIARTNTGSQVVARKLGMEIDPDLSTEAKYIFFRNSASG